jgi:SNF2 family DNA or RNA helicase
MEYKLTIERNKVKIIGDISILDTSNLINWSPSGLLDSGSFDKDKESIDSLCTQIKSLNHTIVGDDKIRTWYRMQKSKEMNAQLIHDNTYQLNENILNNELKDYQKQAISFFEQLRSCIIAYSPGLGKTLIGINCIKIINAKKILVVCPSYLKFSWADEIKKWTTDMIPIVINGTPKQRDKQYDNFINTINCTKILIVNYEQIRIKKSKNHNGKQSLEINIPNIIKNINWDIIIWDEAHRLKSRNSQTTLGNFSLKTKNRLMLTGTPITKNPGEIWSLLKILDKDRFRSYWGFVKFYCHVCEGFRSLEIGNLIRPEKYKNMLKPYMLRKTKESVAPELPKKIFNEIYVRMDEKQKKIYNKALLDYLKPNLQSPGEQDIIESDIEKFIRLNQIAQNPVILGGENVSIIKDTLSDMLQDIEDSVIIGTTYIKMSIDLYESIAKKYKNRNVYLINSKVNTKKRYDILEKFKKDLTGILITTIRCLSEGVNLDCCDNIIFSDIEWNCGVNEQFQNRIHRMTSTRVKTYYFLVVKDTVNEYKHKKIYKESKMSQNSLGDNDQKIIRNLMAEYKRSQKS